jgi:BMFP domain-containing protein YqiC
LVSSQANANSNIAKLAEPNAELERAIVSEIQQLLTRDVSMRAQKEILEARILQNRETEIGLEAQIVALETQRDKTAPAHILGHGVSRR